MSDQTMMSARAAEPVGPYPHAKRVGSLLFLSGIGPRKRGSKEIPGVTLRADGSVESYDIVAECKSVFENIRLVLEDAGAKWENIVDVTTFLSNMKDFASATAPAYRASPTTCPAWTEIGAGGTGSRGARRGAGHVARSAAAVPNIAAAPM
jgi:2-aminomuconate deaminase